MLCIVFNVLYLSQQKRKRLLFLTQKIMKLNFQFSGKQVKEILIFTAVVTVVIFVMASSGADFR